MPPGPAPGVNGKERGWVGDSWVGALLEVRGVGVRKGSARLLEAVDLVAEPRSWTAIVGPNGAGKTTLLRCVAALQRHQGGVFVDGRAVTTLSPRERAREIGYAAQVPVLPEAVTVADYVLLGRTPYRPLLVGPHRDDRDIVAASLDRLDLTPLAGRTLRTLSGGERQRAVLARALAQQPRMLLLDEPTAALDLGHAQTVLEMIDELRREQGLTVVTTLHDLVLAGEYADRLVLLAGGRVVAAGPPHDVLTREALATYYGATADVTADATGVRVHPVRPTLTREPQ
jgi:iron complex transport system ATP-binding protein